MEEENTIHVHVYTYTHTLYACILYIIMYMYLLKWLKFVEGGLKGFCESSVSKSVKLQGQHS